MLLRIILILVASLSVISCKDNPPPFPEIKNQYLIYFGNENTCIQYEILSYSPYQIGNAKYLNINSCHLITGFTHQDMKAILQWKEDVENWTKEKLGSCR